VATPGITQLTPFERHQARVAIKRFSAELREYLQAIEAERDSQKQSKDQASRSLTKPQLRLPAGGY
jgi:hypothetical protein